MVGETPILVVTGYSGSGKTTLIERLVGELAARGIRTAVVKHHRHALVSGGPLHDSDRFLRCGAVAVGTIGDEAVTLSWPVATAPDLKALAGLVAADLVLAEGFKATTGPRLIVYGECPQSVEELAPGRDVVAVVGEAPAPGWPWPSFSRNDVSGIADAVAAWLRSRPDARR